MDIRAKIKREEDTEWSKVYTHVCPTNIKARILINWKSRYPGEDQINSFTINCPYWFKFFVFFFMFLNEQIARKTWRAREFLTRYFRLVAR